MMCIVQRQFSGEGERFIPGQLIDASGFRHLHLLINQRYLRPASEEELQQVGVAAEPPRPRVKKKVR